MALTGNAVSTIVRMIGSSADKAFTPTLQIIHLKKIENTTGDDERWKVCSTILECLIVVEIIVNID